MKRKIVLSAMLACLLAIGLAFVGCDSGTTNPDAPVINKLIVGIMWPDYDAGKPEKTVFNKDDHFYYAYDFSDSNGDWKQMVHTVKVGGKSYDLTWNIPDSYIGMTRIKSNGGYNLGNSSGGYNFGSSGTYELTWYILDQAGNKSNVITRTITVN
jgi:hypothetical protein